MTIEPLTSELGTAQPGRPGTRTCTCSDSGSAEFPELDARVIPHAIRHAAVFGALGAIESGEGMILVAPHDPLPLLGQVHQRDPGAFDVSYLERGPDAWRVLLHRTAV